MLDIAGPDNHWNSKRQAPPESVPKHRNRMASVAVVTRVLSSHFMLGVRVRRAFMIAVMHLIHRGLPEPNHTLFWARVRCVSLRARVAAEVDFACDCRFARQTARLRSASGVRKPS